MNPRGDPAHFPFGHTELRRAIPEKRGPKQGKQQRAEGAFPFLNKHISQSTEESRAAHVTSGNNSQDEILTSATLNTAGALHMAVQVSVYSAFCRKFKRKN